MSGVIRRPKDDSEGLQPKEFDSYQILRANDFVFKMIDLQNISTSRVGLSPYTGLVSPAYIRFTPKEENQYNQFVYYYLQVALVLHFRIELVLIQPVTCPLLPTLLVLFVILIRPFTTSVDHK